jgi:hypothetical protein
MLADCSDFFSLKLNLWQIFSSYNLSTICTVEMTPCTICYPSIKLNTHTLHACTLVIMHVCICCTQALDIMRGRNIQAVMDSHLEGNYSTEVATTLVNLASQCLQYEPRDRPDIKKLVSILEPLQTKLEVTMFILLLFWWTMFILLYFIFDSVFVKGVYLMS